MKRKKLDIMSTKKLIDLFLQEEKNTILALEKEKKNIEKVINLVKKKISKGGRVIYIGAGTSGRIGILDAVETKPTFNVNDFIGIIAGGEYAFIKAKEGAEDNTKDAVSDLKKIKLNPKDVVIGIAASGETPYTLSALKYAKQCKAMTVGISSSENSTLSKIAHFQITPEIKNEIISGSSRLRSGTAQKILLNMISSISMIQSGKVYDDLMIDVLPTNNKLVKRAIGIISTICKLPFHKAEKLFYASKKNTKAAIVMYFENCNLKNAELILKKNNQNLRKSILNSRR